MEPEIKNNPGSYLWGSKWAGTGGAGGTGGGPPSTQPPVANDVVRVPNLTFERYAEYAAKERGLPASAELASRNNQRLQKEVEQHSANLAKVMLRTVANSHILIGLLFTSIVNEGKLSNTDLKDIGELRAELDQLLKATQEAKIALPHFLEKQKENMTLYHHAMMNETLQDSEAELQIQRNKIDIQHGLILDHQSAFDSYKDDTDAKLSEVNELKERIEHLSNDRNELKERVTRLAMEKGLVKQDKQELARLSHALDKAAQELEAAMTSKKELHDQNLSLSSTISGLEKVFAENLDLQKLCKQREEEVERFKTEQSQQSKKIAGLAAELATLSSKYAGVMEKTDSMTDDLDELEKENQKLRQQIMKLDQQQKINAAQLESEGKLKEQLELLKREVNEADRKAQVAKNESDAKIKKLQKENEGLELKHNDLTIETARSRQLAHDNAALEASNEKLQAIVKDLQAKKPEGGAAGIQGHIKTLQDELQESQAQTAKLQSERAEWKLMGEQAYQKYQDMKAQLQEAKSKAREADSVRQEAVALKETYRLKDQEIMQLKTELQAARNTKDTKADGEDEGAVYWRRKYDKLLSDVTS